ncbi:MAG: hypothetical protein ACJ74Q_10495 [Pyrinomonadaceae bacterium]
MSKKLIEDTALQLFESGLNYEDATRAVEREIVRLAFEETRNRDGEPDRSAAAVRLGLRRDTLGWLLNHHHRGLMKELFGEPQRPPIRRPQRPVRPPAPITDIGVWREGRRA